MRIVVVKIVVVNERRCLVKLGSIQHPFDESYLILSEPDDDLTSGAIVAYHSALLVASVASVVLCCNGSSSDAVVLVRVLGI